MTDQKHTKHEFHLLSCHHGRLARKCEICESQDEIKFLSTKLDTVTKQRDELKKVVEFYAEHCLCANCGNSIGGKAIETLTKTKESV